MCLFNDSLECVYAPLLTLLPGGETICNATTAAPVERATVLCRRVVVIRDLEVVTIGAALDLWQMTDAYSFMYSK